MQRRWYSQAERFPFELEQNLTFIFILSEHFFMKVYQNIDKKPVQTRTGFYQNSELLCIRGHGRVCKEEEAINMLLPPRKNAEYCILVSYTFHYL